MAQKFIINTGTAPATFTTKNITININESNISKFFEVDYDNADTSTKSGFYQTTLDDNSFAIGASGSNKTNTLTLTAKYNFSNVSFSYNYVDCGSTGSYFYIYHYENKTQLAATKKISDDICDSASYSAVSKGNSLKVKYTDCDGAGTSTHKQSSITLYNIKITLSLLDILDIDNKIDSTLANVLYKIDSTFSNLSSLRMLNL
jgi:hypothetical protein